MQYDPKAASAYVNTPEMAVVGLHESDKMQFINVNGGLAQLLYDTVSNAWHSNVSMKVKKLCRRFTIQKKNCRILPAIFVLNGTRPDVYTAQDAPSMRTFHIQK